MIEYMKQGCVLNLAVATLFVTATNLFAHGSDNPPLALAELVKQREYFRTGQIEYSVTDYEKAERKSREPREIFYSARFTEDQEVRVNRGDAEGAVLLTTEGDPHPMLGDAPFLIYYEDNAVWERSDRPNDLVRKYESRSSSRGDMRALGLSATNKLNVNLHDLVWRDNVASPIRSKYVESVENDLQVIRVEQSLSSTTYWIDPQRGWSPIRTRVEYPDGEWSEARCVLKNWNGAWYPEIVDSFSSKFHDGAKPTRTIRVTEASMNAPDQPKRLTPESIGITIGSETAVYDQSMKLQMHGRYDGKNIIPHKDYEAKLSSGEIAEEKTSDQDASNSIPTVRTSPPIDRQSEYFIGIENYEKLTPWEEYTREFITQYQLNDEQAQKAWTICRECQNRARNYLLGKRETLRKIDERIDVLRSASPQIVTEEIRRLRQKRDTLITPVEEIFQNDLKPRLNRIPTRAQQQAVVPDDKTAMPKQP